MILNILTLLGNRPHYPSAELFYHPKGELQTHWAVTTHSPLHKSPGNHDSTLPINLTLLNHFIGKILQKLSAVIVLFHLTYCFKIHLCCKMLEIFFIFKAEEYFIICIYHILFIHSSINWYLGCFHLSAMNVSIQISVQIPVLNYFEYVTKMYS